MKTLVPNDEKYAKVVKIESSKKYQIDLCDVSCDERIQCPFDKDMTVSPNKDGTVTVTKKSFVNPIVRQ